MNTLYHIYFNFSIPENYKNIPIMEHYTYNIITRNKNYFSRFHKYLFLIYFVMTIQYMQ